VSPASSSPERFGFLTRPSGRRVAFAEWGPRDGTPVVFHHGSPGSRRFCPDVEAVVDAKILLLTIDRPGYGGTDPLEEQESTRAVAADTLVVADLLGIEDFSVVGWSGGGPYALACAALAPERVRHAAIVSSPAPPEREDIRVDVDALAHWVGREEALLGAVLGPGDEWVRERRDLTEAFVTSVREGWRQGVRGFADDESTRRRSWGFTLADVHTPTDVWHGGKDAEIPLAEARRLAHGLPRGRLTVVPDAGHWVAVSHWHEILASVAAAG
jgi:pimeloyl-ACP methyl ester carboxylesterase